MQASDYLIKHPPLRALAIFALPMMLGNVFQQLYTIADSAIVGRFVSEEALAAIGASYALTNVFICIALGGGIGASVVVSQYFGAHRYRDMNTAIFTALLSFLALSVLMGGMGFVGSRTIMVALHTPANVIDLADTYLRIYFLGLPFLFMYNVLSTVFNALGDSKTPLYFLIFSSVFNIILDLVLVTRFDMGVAGVAWATLIAQGLSAVLSFAVLLRKLRAFSDDKGTLFDGTLLHKMTTIALPSILQQSTVSIGMMLVQSVVNSFGSEALAGFSAAMRIEALCVVPMVAIGNAVSAYTAQNIGAARADRVESGHRAAKVLVLICAALLLITTECFTTPMISAFLGEGGSALALATGCGYIRFMGWFFCFIGFKMSVDGLLRGAGDMRVFTIANLVNLGIRVTVAMLFAPTYGIHMVWVAVPLGWFANWIISGSRYRTGKWKAINHLA